MPNLHEDDGFEYRSPVGPLEAESDGTEVSVDRESYSTLRVVKRILGKAIHDLQRDFNSFGPLNREDPDKEMEALLIEIKSRQMTHAVLSAVFSLVNDATKSIN